MTTSAAGRMLIAAGVVLLLLALLADAVGLGKPGFQAAQVLGVELSVVVILTGAGLSRRLDRKSPRLGAGLRPAVDQILSLPTPVWLVAGFVAVYAALFVHPMFFNTERRIQYFTRYIPEIAPIGDDLTEYAGTIRRVLIDRQDYDNIYPPFFAVIMAPLLLLSYPANYRVVTSLTLLCFTLLLLGLPALIDRRRMSSVTVFFFITGAVSYGLQFELERGQFSLIAFSAALAAIYLHRYHDFFWPLAFVLFTVSIQLKIFPVLLMPLFVKDWRDSRGNLRRIGLLGLANAGLLLALGLQTFVAFWVAVTGTTTSSQFAPYDHSLRSFALELGTSGLQIFPADATAWFRANGAAVSAAVLFLLGVCAGSLMTRAYVRREQGLNLDLLLVCTIGALILPSVSFDYKLALLPPAMALALSGRPAPRESVRWLAASMSLLLSCAYSVTLFSFVDRPFYLANSVPLLLAIVGCITVLSFCDGGNIAPDTRVSPLRRQTPDRADTRPA